jgi:hypothetical protein
MIDAEFRTVLQKMRDVLVFPGDSGFEEPAFFGLG